MYECHLILCLTMLPRRIRTKSANKSCDTVAVLSAVWHCSLTGHSLACSLYKHALSNQLPYTSRLFLLMAPKFLCCLPLRLGVAVISFIQFVFCGGTAGLLWWALWSNQAHNDCQSCYFSSLFFSESHVILFFSGSEMTKNMKLTVIIVASVYTFATLVSLLGYESHYLHRLTH